MNPNEVSKLNENFLKSGVNKMKYPEKKTTINTVKRTGKILLILRR